MLGIAGLCEEVLVGDEAGLSSEFCQIPREEHRRRVFENRTLSETLRNKGNSQEVAGKMQNKEDILCLIFIIFLETNFDDAHKGQTMPTGT